MCRLQSVMLNEWNNSNVTLNITYILWYDRLWIQLIAYQLN